MSLSMCRECGKQVSTEATTCPHCGAPSPSAAANRTPPTPAPQPGQIGTAARSSGLSKAERRIGLTLFVVLLVLAFGAIAKMGSPAPESVSPAPSSEAPSASAPAPAPPIASEPRLRIGETYVINEGFPACQEHDWLKDFMRYFHQKDEGALRESINRGRCILVKPGRAEILEKDMWSDDIKVRLVGTTLTAWTTESALTP
jgi:hypothetical protein